MIRRIGIAAATICLACGVFAAKKPEPKALEQGKAKPVESSITQDQAVLQLYHPNYILPFYYTQDPYQSYYAGHTPNNQAIGHTELKFQISIKFPLVQHLYWDNLSLYAAYTQMSYWQAYNESAFFRETNYEPEIFLQLASDHKLGHGFTLQDVDFGAFHQSNGRGGTLERSWNRAYVKGIFSHGDHWLFIVQPWFVFLDSSYLRYNPHMDDFLGHGQWTVAYKWRWLTVSLTSRNNAESGFSRGAEWLTASFPFYGHLRGYVQAFSGYGQSLAEYDHYTNAIGVGVTLNDIL